MQGAGRPFATNFWNYNLFCQIGLKFHRVVPLFPELYFEALPNQFLSQKYKAVRLWKFVTDLRKSPPRHHRTAYCAHHVSCHLPVNAVERFTGRANQLLTFISKLFHEPATIRWTRRTRAVAFSFQSGCFASGTRGITRGERKVQFPQCRKVPRRSQVLSSIQHICSERP